MPFNVIWIVEVFVAFVIALALHESAHAAMAAALGDSTPLSSGRFSLAPRRHMSAIGTIVAIVFAMRPLLALPTGLGWGKPVDVDARRLRVGPNFGLILVALAGPLVNALLGFAVLFGLRLLPGANALQVSFSRCTSPDLLGIGLAVAGQPLQTCLSGAQNIAVLRVEQFLFAFAVSSIALAILNIIPLHPLDGYKILFALLPNRQAVRYRDFEPYMEFTLLVIFFVLPVILNFVGISLNLGNLLVISPAYALARSVIGNLVGVFLLL
jgi:Zn-dependent protease